MPERVHKPAAGPAPDARRFSDGRQVRGAGGLADVAVGRVIAGLASVRLSQRRSAAGAGSRPPGSALRYAGMHVHLVQATAWVAGLTYAPDGGQSHHGHRTGALVNP